MIEIDEKKLIEEAEKARLASYSPYSGFSVGAALLCSDGKIYHGCNIENTSFTPTCCAERVAIFKAVSEGRRDFVAISVVGGHRGKPSNICAPCGVCRQVLAEFCAPNTPVILGSADGQILRTTVGDILPYTFKLREDL